VRRRRRRRLACDLGYYANDASQLIRLRLGLVFDTLFAANLSASTEETTTSRKNTASTRYLPVGQPRPPPPRLDGFMWTTFPRLTSQSRSLARLPASFASAVSIIYPFVCSSPWQRNAGAVVNCGGEFFFRAPPFAVNYFQLFPPFVRLSANHLRSFNGLSVSPRSAVLRDAGGL